MRRQGKESNNQTGEAAGLNIANSKFIFGDGFLHHFHADASL
jgi:hypothetical protein